MPAIALFTDFPCRRVTEEGYAGQTPYPNLKGDSYIGQIEGFDHKN